MGSGTTFGGIGAFLVILALGFGVREYRKSLAADEVLKDLIAEVSQVEGYGKDPAYFDSLAEMAHDRTFDEALEATAVSARRRRVRFNPEVYEEKVWPRMIEQAQIDGRPRVAAALRALREGQEEEEPRGRRPR